MASITYTWKDNEWKLECKRKKREDRDVLYPVKQNNHIFTFNCVPSVNMIVNQVIDINSNSNYKTENEDTNLSMKKLNTKEWSILFKKKRNYRNNYTGGDVPLGVHLSPHHMYPLLIKACCKC